MDYGGNGGEETIGAHIGGGFIYWFNDDFGFRFEWRNTFNANERFFSGIRLGVTFK